MRDHMYIPEMTTWYRKINGDWDLIASLSRATRAPGKYTITWDGLNDAGKPVPQGDYVINVEINREHGGHTTQKAAIKAGSEAATVDLKATSESEASTVNYGPKSAAPAP
jgi:thiamine biosynthesis lipoprotein